MRPGTGLDSCGATPSSKTRRSGATGRVGPVRGDYLIQRAHVLGALIWLPLLLCPLMHIFMHGGHGGHGGHGQDDREGRAP